MPSEYMPERLEYQEESDAYTHIIRGAGGRFICQLPQNSSERNEAIARRMVLTWNSHDALLGALKNAADELASLASGANAAGIDDGSIYEDIERPMRAAIKQARREG